MTGLPRSPAAAGSLAMTFYYTPKSLTFFIEYGKIRVSKKNIYNQKKEAKMETPKMFEVVVKLLGLYLVFIVVASTEIGAVQLCQNNYEKKSGREVSNSFIDFIGTEHVAVSELGPTQEPRGVIRFIQEKEI